MLLSFKSDETKAGVQRIWDNNLPEADAIFEKTKDTDARSALHYAEAYWLVAFTCDVKEHQVIATNRLSQARKLAEKALKASMKIKTKNNETLNHHLDVHLIRGEACMLTAFHMMTSTYAFAKAMMQLKSAWDLFQDAERLVQNAPAKANFEDDLILLLHFDLGIFLYFLSLLPQFLGPAAKLLKLVGLKGDKERGLEYLDSVAHSDSLRSAYAYNILILRHLFMPPRTFPYDASNDPQEAIAQNLMQEAAQKWPNSWSFRIIHAMGERRFGRNEAAIAELQAVSAKLSEVGINPVTCVVNIAHAYYNMLDLDAAIDLYLQAENTECYIRPYQPKFWRGVCLIMKGDDVEGHRLISDAIKLAKSAEDTEFQSIAERYHSNGFLAFYEILYLREEIPINKAEQLLEMLDESGKILGINKEDRGDTPTTKKYKCNTSKHKTSLSLSYHLMRGTFLHLLKRNDEAMNEFIAGQQLTPHGKFEKQLYWTTFFDLADILQEHNKPDEAVAALKKIAGSCTNPRFKYSARDALLNLHQEVPQLKEDQEESEAE